MLRMISSGTLATLFPATRYRLISLFFDDPTREFSTRDVIRQLNVGDGTVHRELLRFRDAGLLSVVPVGNQRRYQANRDAAVFAEMRELIAKTTGCPRVISDALAPIRPRIRFAYLHGSIVDGTDTARSDIGLVVAGEGLSEDAVIEGLEPARIRLGRRIAVEVESIATLRSGKREGPRFWIRG